MKKIRLISAICFLLAMTFNTQLARAEYVEIPASDSYWLDQLNYYRLSSGLDPVTESPEYSKAAEAHAKYLSDTDPSLFVGEYLNKHSENPASPYATKDGVTIGAGNISWSSKPGLAAAVDNLMNAPIHAIGFLRENLTKVGAAEMWSNNDKLYVQTFSMISGMKTTPRTKVVLFPGDGAIVKLNSFTGGENPEPRESCSGKFSDWKGLGIIASLLNTPSKELTATLTFPDGTVLNDANSLCVITELTAKTNDPTYGPAMKSIYKSDHMVLIFAKSALEEGKHSVSIKQPNQSDINWSFTVLTPPKATNASISENGKSLVWKPVEGSSLNPVIGYTVNVSNQAYKPLNSFAITGTSMKFNEMNLGENLTGYIFCVSVRTKVHSTDGGACVYGPPKSISQQFSISPQLSKNSASIGKVIYITSNGYDVKNIVSVKTPEICTAKTDESQVMVVGSKAGNCNFIVSNEGAYGIAEASQEFTIKIVAGTASKNAVKNQPKLMTIFCKKLNQTKIITSANPICPKGFVQKK